VRYWMNVEGASISDLEQALEARREREGMGRMRPDPTGRGPGGSNYSPMAEGDPLLGSPDPMLAMQTAKMALPWASEALLSVYRDAYIEYGDTALALQEVRNGAGRQEYDRTFSGNRREDGTLRLGENEYLSTVQSFRNTLDIRGLNPDTFEQRFGELIGGEVSANEFESRVRAVSENIVQQSDGIRRAFSEASGVEFNDAAILATVIDPEGVGRELLERRISVAQVQGSAIDAGLMRSRDRAAQLVEGGVGLAQARQFDRQAGLQLNTLQGIARRREGSTIGMSAVEDAFLLQEADDMRRVEGLLSRERSAFSRTRGLVQQEGNALTGLAPSRSRQ